MSECPASVNIRGEHFPCDWPTGDNGRHDGWNHASKAAQAVWTANRNAPLSPPESITTQDDLDQVQDAMGWLCAVQDKYRRVWTLVDDGGVLWATYGDSPRTWRPAREVLADFGPLKPLTTGQVAGLPATASAGGQAEIPQPVADRLFARVVSEEVRALTDRLAAEGHGHRPHPCPHCPCTQTTECCYCDGTRTPLEDS